ncbi:MAG: glycoside hydrolase family 43 protein [Clostridiales bacterium]|nr:glycoside hydrolase family 43 protein [Clostridiales bacterium]
MSYLFVYFTMDGNEDKESIWFSVSRDGLHWKDLGTDEPVLRSRLGTKGVRDPFIVYDGEQKKYFIIVTDLLTANGCGWDNAASKGSRSILIWESVDLLHWSDERLVEVGIPGAGCVWAPEAIYCEREKAWFVFWASCVKQPGEQTAKQRIYGAFTRDFISFSPAFKYIESDADIIDTDIVWDGKYYYRFSKDDTDKTITVERCRELLPRGAEQYEGIHSELLSGYEGLEGPQVYYLKSLKKWCLIADRYRVKGGYVPFVTDDLSSGVFTQLPDDAYDMGTRRKRHGGILPIPDELADKLTDYYGICEC